MRTTERQTPIDGIRLPYLYILLTVQMFVLWKTFVVGVGGTLPIVYQLSILIKINVTSIFIIFVVVDV